MNSKQEQLLSAALIVKNESEHLGRCLKSLDGLVDEIVVLDTGSEDDTMEIARSFGARVFAEPWQDDFSLHRNHAIEKTTSQWVLIIDADEEVVDTDKEETRYHLEHQDLPPVLLVREHLLYPANRRVTYFHARLVKKSSGVRYVYRVHEQLEDPEGLSTLSNVHLLHHGYVDMKAQMLKEQRNLKLAMAMPDDDPHALHCRMRSLNALRQYAESIEYAQMLLDCEASDTLKIEACNLGAQAALNCANTEALERFVKEGESIAPGGPDMSYVKALKALRDYAQTLKDGDSNKGGDFLRPWMFWHSKARLDTATAILCGMGDDTVVEFNRGSNVEVEKK